MKENFTEVPVVSCREVTPHSGIFLLTLRYNGSEIQPGQFVMLAPANNSSVMPRPFSVFDANIKTIKILFKVVGANTEIYSRLKRNDRIRITQPLGKAIPIN